MRALHSQCLNVDPVTCIELDVAEDGRCYVDWHAAFGKVPVDVYRLPSAPAAPEQIARAAVSELAFDVDDNDPVVHLRLEPAGRAPLLIAERAPRLAGSVNFRDIGGYATDDGRCLRWGRIYRSGHMTNLDERGKQRFAALGINTLCDFRLAEERAREKTELPGPPELRILGIPPGIGDKRYFHRLFAASTSPEPVMEAMHALFGALVRDCAPYFTRLFETLLEAPPGALLLNCSAGKERTGTGVALLMSALGVPRETIMYDFMLSERYLPIESEVPRALKKYEVAPDRPDGRAVIMPLLETHESFLNAAFTAIESDHGNVETFLEHHYGLDQAARARLRDIYTV